jgi:hypothetical protein
MAAATAATKEKATAVLGAAAMAVHRQISAA